MIRTYRKYAEVAAITVRSSWAYVWNQLVSSLWLFIIIFVFVQLWKTTFAAQGEVRINGFTLTEMIWYLVATEVIILSLPRVQDVLEQEVKDGDIALRLNKPYSYLGFHYASFVGEGLVRLVTRLLAGGLTAYLLVGGFDFHWAGLPLIFLIYLTTHLLNFFWVASIGLLAFWVEEVVGLYLLFDRFKWILGGMLLPVAVYPDSVRRLVELLPFQYMVGGPADLFVHFTWAGALAMLQNQLIWILIFGLVCNGIYRLGVRKVDVNGG